MDSKPFDPTKPVQTRDGRPARILCANVKRSAWPIVAAVTDPDGSESVVSYTAKGRELRLQETENDLLNAPEETTEWINYYGDESVRNKAHSSLDIANHYATGLRQALFKVTKVDGKVTKVEVVQ
jgi:hypothetical protein